MLLSCIAAILFFSVVVLLHELGHFLAARHFGVRVEGFSIGFGPALFSHRSEKSGTVYAIRLLPLGGYVMMTGEDGDATLPDSFPRKSVGVRALILAAGALMNLLLGFLLMLVCTLASEKLYGTTVAGFALPPQEDGTPEVAYQGLYVGDEILSIDRTRLHVRYDFLYAAMRAQDREVTLTVRRNGETLTIPSFRFPTTIEDGDVFGDPSVIITAAKEKNVGSVLNEVIFQPIAAVRMVVLSLADLIAGRYSTEALSGPVGIVSEVKETAGYGFFPLLFLMAILTINIGVCNLLPLPALDGGRLVLLLVEAITKKRVDPSFEALLNTVGLLLLLAFMLFITYKDILKLFR